MAEFFFTKLNLWGRLCPTSEIVCFSGIYFYIFLRKNLRYFLLDLVIFLRRIFFFVHTNWHTTIYSIVQAYR